MALGSFALVGLTVTGPDMRATGATYFKELNSADLTILSDYGIDENEEKLNDAKEKLEKLDAPTYSVDNRREISGGDGYSVYETVSEIVDSLAKVFPVFLYFVEALVTFTTMTRFVSEERINNGTLKSLGYQDKDVIQKFVVYGFIAGMTGTALGIVLGHTLLSHIVYNAYKHGFILPPIELHFYVGITILAIIIITYKQRATCICGSKRRFTRNNSKFIIT